jgi:hypothetical protein
VCESFAVDAVDVVFFIAEAITVERWSVVLSVDNSGCPLWKSARLLYRPSTPSANRTSILGSPRCLSLDREAVPIPSLSREANNRGTTPLPPPTLQDAFNLRSEWMCFSLTLPVMSSRCDFDCYLSWSLCSSLCRHGKFRDGVCRSDCPVWWNACKACSHGVFRCPLCGVKVKTDPADYGLLPTPIGCHCPNDAEHPVDVCRRLVYPDVGRGYASNKIISELRS